MTKITCPCAQNHPGFSGSKAFKRPETRAENANVIQAAQRNEGNILTTLQARNMAIFQKGTKRYSIFNLKCPRCHEGDMFETGSWSFKKSFDMFQRCPKCNLNYFPEPGYYYGAMFISYIWSGWFCLLFVAFFHWYLGLSQTWAFGLLGAFLVINFVYVFRISRLMWINIHVRYNPNAIEKHQHECEIAAKTVAV